MISANSNTLGMSFWNPPVTPARSDEQSLTVQKSNAPSSWSRTYNLFVISAGAIFYLVAVLRLDTTRLDLRFGVITVLTLFITSRIVIPLPRFSSHISVSDTFIFIALLLYGGPAAILLAATESLLSSFRFSRKPYTILFNWGSAACSAGLTTLVLHSCFGDIVSLNLKPITATLVLAMSVMALAQYVTNSVLVAICGALKSRKSVWQIWRKYYLWTSITYLAGASAATMISRLTDHVGFYALVVTLPIIGIVFLTYRTYLKNIEASAAQAEQAENHVRELSHYIKEQERIREQFSQIEKLSALGELASGVAHDFNNTLAGILGRAQLLLRTQDPEKLEKGLKIIIKTAEDGAKTVKRIQDFARQRRDHDFEAVSVSQILQDVSEITRPRWKDQAEASNVHINLQINARSQSKVMGDESELRDVLVNMVFNAVDAMANGGTLELAVEDIDESVVLSVRDTGCGMTPEIRSRIFDPFFTTKGTAGMGLGLAVSFGIVRRHEGRIDVDSDPSIGTTFRVVLPKAHIVEDSPQQTGVTSDNSEVSVSNETRQAFIARPSILVVDDEEYIRELLRDILETEGCRVYVASGGQEALALFDAREFQAVLTDVGMPGMSGWELAQSIREKSKIPIALITGWGEAVSSDQQKAAEVNWVIAKPFTADRIAELAQQIIRAHESTVAQGDLTIVAA